MQEKVAMIINIKTNYLAHNEDNQSLDLKSYTRDIE